jgi:hypothetical protein
LVPWQLRQRCTYGVGATLTWYGANGYLDAQGQVNCYQIDLQSKLILRTGIARQPGGNDRIANELVAPVAQFGAESLPPGKCF